MHDSQLLLDRFSNEFDHYFGKPDSDQRLMMVLHPLFVWQGFA
jgi:hypothetical protein